MAAPGGSGKRRDAHTTNKPEKVDAYRTSAGTFVVDVHVHDSKVAVAAVLWTSYLLCRDGNKDVHGQNVKVSMMKSSG